MVIEWGQSHLKLPLEKAAMLPGLFALGAALGAVTAARFVELKRVLVVLPVGIVIGLVVISMVTLESITIVCLTLAAIGALAGFFLVPMNALLQHRGHVLMS